MFDAARIVGVFQDDEHPETCAVGIVSEDGNSLLFSVEDPETIAEMANRLLAFADEIQSNQNRNINRVIAQLSALGPGATMGDLAAHQKRLRGAGVVSLEEAQRRRAAALD